LKEHKEGHARLAQLLIEREVIFAEDVEKIFGKRPWASRSEELFGKEDSANNGNETTVENADGITPVTEEELQASTEKENKENA
jgi:cell division protease FtsH